jgi:transposase-like protein
MDKKLRAFRKQAREENRGRRGLARRYSRQLRLDAVAYLKRKKRDGMSVERVASELGVSNWSLSRWSQESERRGEVVPVEVTASEESAKLSLVTPKGYRIEGLSEERVLRLVERLG